MSTLTLVRGLGAILAGIGGFSYAPSMGLKATIKNALLKTEFVHREYSKIILRDGGLKSLTPAEHKAYRETIQLHEALKKVYRLL